MLRSCPPGAVFFSPEKENRPVFLVLSPADFYSASTSTMKMLRKARASSSVPQLLYLQSTDKIDIVIKGLLMFQERGKTSGLNKSGRASQNTAFECFHPNDLACAIRSYFSYRSSLLSLCIVWVSPTISNSWKALYGLSHLLSNMFLECVLLSLLLQWLSITAN